MIPREPNEQEQAELIELKLREMTSNPSEDDIENTTWLITGACIAVFDSYISDGPGYAGKVMVAVYGGAPEYTETFVWYNGALNRLEIE